MTDKLRAAAQAALELLENLHGAKLRSRRTVKTEPAAMQLRAALAEPEVKQEPADDVWFEDRNGAIRKSPRDCQRFDAGGVPEAVWVNGDRYVRREWRSLTDEERQRLLDSTHPDNRWTLAERVEYRLKERNA